MDGARLRSRTALARRIMQYASVSERLGLRTQVRPTKLAGHANVKLVPKIVLALAHNEQAMAPANFSSHWLEFLIVFVRRVKLPPS